MVLFESKPYADTPSKTVVGHEPSHLLFCFWLALNHCWPELGHG